MKYEKAQVEVIRFDHETFMRRSGDVPLGSFTCGSYTQGGSCTNIAWYSTGYKCGSYTYGNCSSVYSPAGSFGERCHAWKLTCSKF